MAHFAEIWHKINPPPQGNMIELQNSMARRAGDFWMTHSVAKKCQKRATNYEESMAAFGVFLTKNIKM